MCPDVSSLGRMLEAPAGRLDPRPDKNRAARSARRGQTAHHCRAFFTSPSSTCCVDAAASNPDINSSKFHKTSENIYSLPVWFWQFRRRLVRFVQNDNGGTTNARTETSECIIKLYKVIWCLQSSSSLPIISGVWAQTLRHNSAMAQVGPPAADSLTSMPSVMYLQLFWILHLLFSWEIMHYSGLHGSWSNSLDWFKGKFTGNHGFYHQI